MLQSRIGPDVFCSTAAPVLPGQSQCVEEVGRGGQGLGTFYTASSHTLPKRKANAEAQLYVLDLCCWQLLQCSSYHGNQKQLSGESKSPRFEFNFSLSNTILNVSHQHMLFLKSLVTVSWQGKVNII